MVRLRIHQIMKARHISAYALSKGTNISYPSAYRLSRPEACSVGCTPRPSTHSVTSFASSPARSSTGFRRRASL